MTFDLLVTGRDDGHRDAEHINRTCANFIPFRMKLSGFDNAVTYMQNTQSQYWKSTEISYVSLDAIYSHLSLSREKWVPGHYIYISHLLRKEAVSDASSSWVVLGRSQVTLTQTYGVVFETSLTPKGYRLKLFYDIRVFIKPEALFELRKIVLEINKLLE